MAKIQNEQTYKAIMDRIEELLPLTDENTPMNNRYLLELNLLSELASEYEKEHYSIGN